MPIEAYPGVPPLSWHLAKRVTNPYEDADAFVSVTGRKGSGKSTATLALAEDTAKYIARMRGKGEKPEDFFTIDHVKSVTSSGMIDLLSSGELQKENQIFVIDDTGTQFNARKFNSATNIAIGSILQICRIYKSIIFANFIMFGNVDKNGRELSDYRAEMVQKNTFTKQAVFKFFLLEQGKDARGQSKEYHKFLSWHGKRIKYWVISQPSNELNEQYKKMRRESTDQFIQEARDKLLEDKKPKKSDRVKEASDDILSLYRSGMNLNAIAAKVGLSRYHVAKAVSGLTREEDE